MKKVKFYRNEGFFLQKTFNLLIFDCFFHMNLGVRGTPPTSALYSSSPATGLQGSIFPIGYQPPPPNSMIPNLAGALSQLSISQQQPALDRHDSFSTSNAQLNHNYGPHGVPPQQSSYFVMTPPNGILFGIFVCLVENFNVFYIFFNILVLFAKNVLRV